MPSNDTPTLSKAVSVIQAKWMKLMKAGGIVKRLWVPSGQKGESEILPFEVWYTLREYLLKILKGIVSSFFTRLTDYL